MTLYNGMFAGITSGLTSTYSLLSNASSGNVTLDTINQARSNSTYATSLNQNFASYIQSNFSTLDKNHDGTLSAAELNSVTTSMNTTGMTAAQLTQLGTASGLSGNDLSQVLEHFAEIDTNGDGKVSTSEIQGYKLKSEMEKKKTEFSNRAAANQSLFYGDDDSSSKADSSSMVDFKYWNNNTSNSSGS